MPANTSNARSDNGNERAGGVGSRNNAAHGAATNTAIVLATTRRRYKCHNAQRCRAFTAVNARTAIVIIYTASAANKAPRYAKKNAQWGARRAHITEERRTARNVKHHIRTLSGYMRCTPAHARARASSMRAHSGALINITSTHTRQ